MPIDVSGFNVPQTPYREPRATERLADNMQQNRLFNYRMQRDKESQDLQKLELIREFTDPKKYHTGSDVADGLSNKKMTEVLQNYSGRVGNMTMPELQYNLARETGGVLSITSAMKDELVEGEKRMAQIKAENPDIDISTLSQNHRADVIHRYFNDDGSDFDNPTSIANKPHKIDLYDDNTLSKYVSTKKLDEAIQNPKGLDPIAVAAGNEYQNVVSEGKIPHWMTPNYTADDLKKGGGFLKRGFIPQLSIKSGELPTDMLPSLQGEQRKIVTSDVHKQFKDDYKLQVMHGTRQMFGDKYDEMTDTEKQLAESDFLYSKIKALDKSGFMYKSSTHPSAAQNKIFMGDSGKGSKGAPTLNDVYPRIVSTMSDPQNNINFKGEKIGTTMNGLDAESQKIIFDYFGGRKDDFNEKNTFLADKDGVPTLYRVDAGEHPNPDKAHEVGAIPESIDVKVQVTAKDKEARLHQIHNNEKQNKSKGELD